MLLYLSFPSFVFLSFIHSFGFLLFDLKELYRDRQMDLLSAGLLLKWLQCWGWACLKPRVRSISRVSYMDLSHLYSFPKPLVGRCHAYLELGQAKSRSQESIWGSTCVKPSGCLAAFQVYQQQCGSEVCIIEFYFQNC